MVEGGGRGEVGGTAHPSARTLVRPSIRSLARSIEHIKRDDETTVRITSLNTRPRQT